MSRCGWSDPPHATVSRSQFRRFSRPLTAKARRNGNRHECRKVIRLMFALRLLAFVVFCALPAGASAQAWADAYAAGNYDKAADLLHQVVIESTVDIVSAVPEPYRQLAQMYSEGRGVPKDAIAACSLARMAGQATMMTAPKRYSADIKAYDAAHKESDEFIRTHCDSLTARRPPGRRPCDGLFRLRVA